MVSQSQRMPAGSATEVMHPAFELERLSMPMKSVHIKEEPQHTMGHEPCSRSVFESGEDAAMEPHTNPIMATERWNESQRNVFRIAAAFFCFVVMGANDSAYGVCAFVHYLISIHYTMLIIYFSHLFHMYVYESCCSKETLALMAVSSKNTTTSHMQ